MTVTRKCRTKGCPFTPDEHEEWMALCRRAPEHGHRDDQLSHQHHPKKGMGGHNSKSKIVAVFCWPMHDRIDNGDWGNDVKNGVYFAFDLHGNTLIERAIPEARRLSDGAEAAVRDPTPPSGPSASSLSQEEESDGRQPEIRDSGGGNRNVATVGNEHHSSSPLTHEQRVAIAKEIKDTEWNRQWVAGDTANAWRAELGEEAEQYLSDFGYVELSLANIMRVCENIPPPLRNAALRFSHHVVVSNLSPETIMISLTECADEGWSVAEFRRQVKGTKPKVKRWTLEELNGFVDGYPDYEARPLIRNWVAWLGEQG